jgi:hypothetical protein
MEITQTTNNFILLCFILNRFQDLEANAIHLERSTLDLII